MFSSTTRTPKIIPMIIIAVIIVAVLVGIISSTIVDVDPGYGSALVDPFAGTVKPGPIGPAFIIGGKAPWVEVKIIKISVDRLYMWTALNPDGTVKDSGWLETQRIRQTNPSYNDEWDAPAVLSKDGLTIVVDLNIRWTLDSTKLSQLYLNYPALNWKDAAIAPIVREAVRDLIVQFPAVEAYAKRAELVQPLSQYIVERVDRATTLAGAVKIEAVEILDIVLPATVKTAIEQKQASLQAIETAKNLREATIVNADAERQSVIIRAEGLAKARIIEANATRESIEIAVQALGGDKAEAARLFYQLTQLQKIAETGSNVIILVGRSETGLFFLIPIEKK